MSEPGENRPPPPRAPYATEAVDRLAGALREADRPSQIGRFHILDWIGEGGMGSVYKAEQREPIHRVVAVKVIKLGLDSRDIIARFETERQAIALMDHPNVARAIDAGATQSGRPYFVMEYVRGEPITKFADRTKLTIEQRLELFRQACDAVQHAHQKAIIHRDLKPSNILVTEENGSPWVKVIDFGVAKALDQQLTEKTLYTEQGRFIGTLEYMSPEQADGRGHDVDTRSDVYSLGVVLYELLTGAVPFDAARLRTAGYQEMQRIIREVDPPRPSTKLSGLGEVAAQVASQRQIELNALERQLHRELDWIPLKAMRKDRTQRYATATELSDDIGNYLANRPLRAGPESVAYRARKFLRRNKTSVAASAAILLLLIGGIVATSWQAIRAMRAEARTRAEQLQTLTQKREAEDAKAAAEQVSAFLSDMLQAADPWPTRGKPVLVRDVLDRASTALSDKLTGQPRVEARLHTALGRSYVALGLYSQADPHLVAMLEINQRLAGEDDPETLNARNELGKLRRVQGRFDEALAMHKEVLDRQLRLSGPDDRRSIATLNLVGVVLEDMGKLREAEPCYREARERFTRTLGRDDIETARVTGNLGDLLNAMGDYDQAESLLRESYEGRRKLLGDDDPDTLIVETELADVLRHQDKLPEAEALLRHALEHTRKVVGDDHPRTSFAQESLALVLKLAGKNDESIALYRESLTRLRQSLGNDDPSTLTTLTALAMNLLGTGKPADAEPLLREAYEGSHRRLGADHPTTVSAEFNLAMSMQLQGRWEDSLPAIKDVYERLREPGRVQFSAARRARTLGAYGICLQRLARFDEAREPLMVARAALIEQNDTASTHYRNVILSLLRNAEARKSAGDVARWSTELTRYEASTRPTTRP